MRSIPQPSTGRTHTFNKTIKFSTQHDYLEKLHTFKENFTQLLKETWNYRKNKNRETKWK